MNRKLMIKILELLEEAYPESYNIEKLRTIINPSPGQGFFQIIKYLKDSFKINYLPSESKPSLILMEEKFASADKIRIDIDGIAFLSKIRGIEANEERNKIITKATVVLALVGFIQALIYFEQFSNEVNDIYSWLALLVIGFIIIIILTLVFEPFTQAINFRK